MGLSTSVSAATLSYLQTNTRAVYLLENRFCIDKASEREDLWLIKLFQEYYYLFLRSRFSKYFKVDVNEDKADKFYVNIYDFYCK